MEDDNGRVTQAISVLSTTHELISNNNAISNLVKVEDKSAQEKDQIYHQLIDMFVDAIEPNIIQDIIQNRNYDLDGALDDLFILSQGIRDIQNNPSPQLDEILSPEKTSEEENSCSSSSNEEVLHTASEGMDAIRVSYSSVGEENEDADVIIEEENEFVFLNGEEIKSNSSSAINSLEDNLIKNFKSLFSILKPKEKEPIHHQQSQKSDDKLKINPVLEKYQLIKKVPNAFDRIMFLIKENIKVLILIRGCSGSGKSHLAKTIMKKTSIDISKFDDHILSTDSFFKVGKEYVFNPEKLSEAHSWNQKRVLVALCENRSPVIVDNTNSQMWEMRPYGEMAVAQGYDLEILEPETWWAFNDKELSKRNIHSVPKRTIRNMLDRYEKNITSEKLFNHYGLKYSPSNAPPQLIPIKKPTSSVNKRGCRSRKKSKKIVSDINVTSGLPDSRDTSIFPSAPPQELHSLELTPGSNTFEGLCNYYRSLNFDKMSPKEEKTIKTNENSTLLNTNLTEQPENATSFLNRSSVPSSCYKNLGYSSSTNTSNIFPSKTNNSSDDLKTFEIYEQQNHFIDKTIKDDKPTNDGFSQPLRMSLYQVKVDESPVQKNVVDKLNFKDKHLDPELIDKLVKGELYENELTDSKSIFNSFGFLNEDGNILTRKDKIQNHIEKRYEIGSQKVNTNEGSKVDVMSPYLFTMESSVQPVKTNIAEESAQLKNADMLKSKNNYNQHDIIDKKSIGNEIKKELQNDDVSNDTYVNKNYIHNNKLNFGQWVTNETDNKTSLLSNIKGNDTTINFDHAQQIPLTKNVQEKKINENTCRQFVMYSSEGFLYSDPVYNNSSDYDSEKNVENRESLQSNQQLVSEIPTLFTEFLTAIKPKKFNRDLKPDDCEGTLHTVQSASISCTAGNINADHINQIENLSINDLKEKSGFMFNEPILNHAIKASKSSNIVEKIDHLLESVSSNIGGRNESLRDNNESEISSSNMQVQDPIYNLASNSDNGACLSVVEEELPQIDLMSIFVGTNEVPSPKPARQNTKKRAPKSSSFSYQTLSMETSPEELLWDTVGDPLSLWNTSKDIKKTVVEEHLENISKPQRELTKRENRFNVVEKTDSSTNISYTDFESNLTDIDFSNEKILSCKNRNICDGIVVSPTKVKSTVLLLDKGTMTSGTENKFEINRDQLLSLFPHLQEEALIELVEKCQGDLNWALDLLLDSNQVSLPEGYKNTASMNVISKETDKNQDKNKVNINSTGARKKTPKCDRKQISKESSLELKELIEKNIVLDESHYSEHVLKIMKRKRDLNKKEDCQQDNSNQNLEKKTEDISGSGVKTNVDEEQSPSPDTQCSSHFVIEKLEEEEEGKALIFVKEENSDCKIFNESLEEGDEEEGEDLVPFAFDKKFILQLQEKFGGALLSDMIEESSVIELPISLACQLYYYVVDSIQQKTDQQQDIIDAMIKEDEEFARQLQENEDRMEEKIENRPVPLLQEIMDMEMALAFYKADQDDWRQQNQNTMAAKLSMQLLIQSFPNIDKNVLMEIFHANNCSLHDTVQSLNLALSDDQPDLARREEELLAKLQTVKSQESQRCAIVVSDIKRSSNPRQEALQEVEEYRRQASCYYQLRNDCFQKAQEAFRSGNTAVASYYSQLAALHKDRTDFFNSQAAACLFHARAKSSTLDLHFLHVAEAIEVLDIFLDEEISQLIQSKKKKSVVFIITGRGLRSVGGVSRIKPNVQRRLHNRRIIYHEVNPGMLSAVLTCNTKLTCNI